MQRTGIEYLTHTWNPIVMRCTPVSPGCANCWHIGMAKRHAMNLLLPKRMRSARGGGTPYLDGIELQAPMRLRKSARIGVEFMGDLFHETVLDEWLDKIFSVMAASQISGHIFQVLTKRPERMLKYLSERLLPERLGKLRANLYGITRDEPLCIAHQVRIPLPNVWLGVTAENQEQADKRIPLLLQTPAAVRFVSVEPMLETVDLRNGNSKGMRDWLCQCGEHSAIDWVICGGESGPRARSMHPDWPRGLRDQCVAAGVPFTFKQWGEWAPIDYDRPPEKCFEYGYIAPDGGGLPNPGNGYAYGPRILEEKGCLAVGKIGKKAAGRELDGKMWDQRPETKVAA